MPRFLAINGPLRPMPTFRRRLIPAIAAALLIGAPHAVSVADRVPDHLPVTDLRIATANGIREFRVSVASRPKDRRRGLMYVTELAADEGMLFDFGTPSIQGMWMKNTLLSLDMLFIREDGSISSIARDTVPHSRKTIVSEEPVKAVLELRGGVCKLLDIAPGDMVLHPVFGNSGRPPAD